MFNEMFLYVDFDNLSYGHIESVPLNKSLISVYIWLHYLRLCVPLKDQNDVSERTANLRELLNENLGQLILQLARLKDMLTRGIVGNTCLIPEAEAARALSSIYSCCDIMWRASRSTVASSVSRSAARVTSQATSSDVTTRSRRCLILHV